MLPEHVRSHLVLNDDASNFEQMISTLDRPFLGVIHSEEGVSCLRALSTQNEPLPYEIEIISRPGSSEAWQFSEFFVDSGAVLDVVCIPMEIPAEAPPTKVEELLVKAWFAHEGLIAGNAEDGFGLVAGKTLLFWKLPKLTSERSNRLRKVASSLLGFGEVDPQLSYVESWGDFTSFNLSNGQAKALESEKLTELLRIATKEKSIRWKFLGYYRVIEFGYLSNLLDVIHQDFLKDPTSAVDDAAQALKNEFNQFRKLSSEHNLDLIFENLLASFDQLVVGFNQFACALDRRLKNDPRLKTHTGHAAKGILVVYLIRCSIVHAGEGSLLFEAYPDAEVALVEWIKYIEQAAISYLGIVGS